MATKRMRTVKTVELDVSDEPLDTLRARLDSIETELRSLGATSIICYACTQYGDPSFALCGEREFTGAENAAADAAEAAAVKRRDEKELARLIAIYGKDQRLDP